VLANNTIAEVTELPDCDFGCGETARYDAQTKMGPWAFMCQSCFDLNGPGKLGLGIGQKLQLLEDDHLAQVIGHA
jgi:hypothetical protein